MPYEAAMMNVREIVDFVSDELMAQAALKCKAYARSLLNFEKRVRSMRSEGRKDADMQEYFENMHYIYANLDEPDGMEGVSTRVIAPSLEHQIREHESTGRWTSAQSCWEVELQRKPSDPELHIGLLRCLRNLGHYDTMRTHIRGVLSMHPEWDELLAPFNVEGACILSDWGEVRRALQNGSQQSAAHATARVVLSLKDRDELGMADALRDARRLVGKPIVAAGKGSYARVYEAVTHLHMVNELELIQNKVQLRNKPGGPVSAAHSLREVDPILLARLNATLPSFRTREPLLSLRRSAFAAVYGGDARALGASVGQAWILTAKSARRAGHFQTAYSAVLQSMQCEAPFAFIQRAKLLALDDKKQTAIQELNNAIPNIASAMQAATDAQNKRSAGAAAGVIDLTADEDSQDLMGLGKRAYARAHLLRARLVDETGRYPPNEVIERYKTTSTIDPGSEKLWYRLGHYYDSQKETPVANLMTQSWSVCRYYLKSAQCGTKFFYRTLPRVLTVWLDSGDDAYLINVAKKQEVV
jgi:serine/threonine-protein kinase ATR